MSSLLNRVRPVLGLATAAGTVAAGAAPVFAPMMAGAADSTGHTLVLDASPSLDGTYESCSAYFGFGKNEFGATDVVSFDVADTNGSDGTAHSVQGDTRVILVLENADGETLECMPEELTEAQWNDGLDDAFITLEYDDPKLAYPGPGHFAYPSVVFEPEIDGFGPVTGVGFKVVAIPDGHELVSPTAVTPLVQHFLIGAESESAVNDPRVLDFIEAEAGADARGVFEESLVICPGNPGVSIGSSLLAAVNALAALRGYDPLSPGDATCGDVLDLNAEATFVLGINETRSYVEPISLALPTLDTTSTTTTTSATTTTTTVPTSVEVTAAVPVVASPDYTG